MTIDEAIATLDREFQEIADRVSAEAVEVIRPQLRQIAARYTLTQVREKLKRNQSDPQGLQRCGEDFLLQLIIEEMEIQSNCTGSTQGISRVFAVSSPRLSHKKYQ